MGGILTLMGEPRKMLQRFKDEHTFEKRVEEADKIRKKHPDRIPVICEKAEGSDIAEIDRKKYLVPQELTVGQFVYVVRKRLRLPPEKAISIFVDGHLPSRGSPHEPDVQGLQGSGRVPLHHL